RPPFPHLFERSRLQLEEELLRRTEAHSDRRSQGQPHQGGAGMNAVPTPKIDPAKTHLLKEYKHGSPLLGCRFDPSGQFVFAGAQDNNIVRWNLEIGKKTLLIGHKSWVRALAFSAGASRERQRPEQLLFSGDYAGRILTWQAGDETPKPVRTIEAHRGW